MKRTCLPTIKGRSDSKRLDQFEITETLGEAHLRSTMALCGWTLEKASTQSDNRKIDFTCRFGHAKIEIQLKSRNIDWNHKNWSWVIYPMNEEIDKKFYDEAYTFLCLIGIKLVEKDGRFHQVVVGGRLPQIALIPGKDVVKYFSEKSSGSGVIRLSLKMLLKREYPKWNKYFGEKNIHKQLMDAWIQAEKEEEDLKRIRCQKQP